MSVCFQTSFDSLLVLAVASSSLVYCCFTLYFGYCYSLAILSCFMVGGVNCLISSLFRIRTYYSSLS